MSRRLISFLRQSKLLVLVSVLILFSGMGTIIAQNPNSVPGMLDEILNRIISLQTSVNTVQTSVNALSAPGAGNVRITPPVNVNLERNESANCQGANVSDHTLTVRIQFINSDGVTLTDQSFSLAAGKSTASGQLSSLSSFPTVYCKFTAVGGTKDDIRGAIAFFNPPTGGARFSLPAE
jgi:hypothetical protein